MANGNGIASVEASSSSETGSGIAALPPADAGATPANGEKPDSAPVATTGASASPPVTIQPDSPTAPPTPVAATAPPVAAPAPPSAQAATVSAPAAAPNLLDQVDAMSEADRAKLLERLGGKKPDVVADSPAMLFARKVQEVQGAKAAAPPPPAPKPPENEDRWRQRPREMSKLRPPFYIWSQEAIEKSKYEFEIAPGKKETRYRPLYGLMLQRFNQPGDGVPAIIFMTFQKVMAADVDGRIVEAEEGKHILVHCNHGLRQLLPILKSAQELGGVALLSITPTGYYTLTDGSREMTFDAEIESDPSNPMLPRIFSKESAIGELKKNFEALR